MLLALAGREVDSAQIQTATADVAGWAGFRAGPGDGTSPLAPQLPCACWAGPYPFPESVTPRSLRERPVGDEIRGLVGERQLGLGRRTRGVKPGRVPDSPRCPRTRVIAAFDARVRSRQLTTKSIRRRLTLLVGVTEENAPPTFDGSEARARDLGGERWRRPFSGRQMR